MENQPRDIEEVRQALHAEYDRLAIERSVTESEQAPVEHVLFPNPFTIGEQIALLKR